MVVFIGLVGLYAALFAASRWGIVGVVVAIAATYIIIRWRLSYERTVAKRILQEMEERQIQRLRDLVTRFRNSGSSFFGVGRNIHEYENDRDLLLDISNKHPNLPDGSLRFLKRSDHKIAVIATADPKARMPEHDLREILRYMTDEAFGSEHYRLVRLPISEFAKSAEEEERRALLHAISVRIANRISLLSERTAVDFGDQATAVYVISGGNFRISKVGISRNPNGRLKSLQTGNAITLSVHRNFWMGNRDDALLLESETHRELQRRGYKRAGEWFPVEPEIAVEALAHAYDVLLERCLVDQTSIEISEASTDAEVLRTAVKSMRWTLSKRSNLTLVMDGRRATIFKRKKGWSWVIDGRFAGQNFNTADEAQFDCAQQFAIDRDSALALILGQKAPRLARDVPVDEIARG